jgi:hypothetical protein
MIAGDTQRGTDDGHSAELRERPVALDRARTEDLRPDLVDRHVGSGQLTAEIAQIADLD